MTTTPRPRLSPQTCLLSSAFSACKMIWWRHIRSKRAAAGWGMIHPAGRAGSALFALLLDAFPCPPAPCPTVRQSVRLHNIIFHIVRSLACHFLHYATVSPLRQAGRVGSSSGLIPKSKPNPQHNLQALLNPAPNVINLRTEVCI